MIKTIRTSHALVVLASLGIGLLAVGVANGRKYSRALHWLRLYQEIDLAALDRAAQARHEALFGETEEALRDGAREAGLQVSEVEVLQDAGFFWWGAESVWDVHGLVWSVKGSIPGFTFDRDELSAALRSVRGELDARFGEARPSVALTYRASKRGRLLASFASEAEQEVEIPVPARQIVVASIADLQPGAEILRHIDEYSYMYPPEGTRALVGEFGDLPLHEAARQLELRASAPKELSMVGVQIGSTTAGWASSALMVLLLLYLVAHLRHARSEGDLGVDGQDYIGLFGDRLSRLLVFASLVLLPLVACIGFAMQETLYQSEAGKQPGRDTVSALLLVALVFLVFYAHHSLVLLRRLLAGGPTSRGAPEELAPLQLVWLRRILWVHLVAALGIAIFRSLQLPLWVEVSGFGPFFSLLACAAAAWIGFRREYWPAKAVGLSVVLGLAAAALNTVHTDDFPREVWAAVAGAAIAGWALLRLRDRREARDSER